MTAKKPGAKMGRPSKFAGIDLKAVQRYGELGMTDDEIAFALGIGERTLEDYKKRPDFLHALKSGKMEADNKVVGALFKKACAGSETAMIFFLKNRQRDRWRDKQEHDINGNLAVTAVFRMPRPAPKPLTKDSPEFKAEVEEVLKRVDAEEPPVEDDEDEDDDADA